MTRIESLRSSARSLILRALVGKTGINLLILLVLCIVLASLTDNFLTSDNLRNVLRQVSIVAIVGAAVTLVMIAGGLDLSIGGVVALAGVVSALLAVHGLPIWLAFLIGSLAGAMAGLVNAALIVQIGINSVIATLGILYVARGVANLLTGGTPVQNVPSGYEEFGTGFAGWLPLPVLAMIGVVATFTFIEKRTVLGRHAVAIGSGFEAARLAGIRVNRVRTTLYVLSGLMAGFGGILISSRLNSGQPTAAVAFEFDVIVAAILGGVSLAGGEGSVIGTLLGALIIGVIGNGLNLLGVEPFWQTIVQGLILVFAVGVDIALRRARANLRRGRLLTVTRLERPST